jgi:hypothetical protein
LAPLRVGHLRRRPRPRHRRPPQSPALPVAHRTDRSDLPRHRRHRTWPVGCRTRVATSWARSPRR